MARKQIKSFMGWTLCGVALVMIFLVVTFPYDQLQARVLAELSRSSGLVMIADQWSLAWPLGLEWRELGLTGTDLPRVLVDRLQLSLLPGSLLEGRPSLAGRAEVGGGSAGQRGQVVSRATLSSWSRPALSHLTGTIERLDLGKLGVPTLKRGLLRADFDQQWRALPGSSGAGQLQPADGQWQIELTEVQLESVPLGPAVLPSVGLASLKGRLLCRDGTCRIEMLEGRGPDGTLKGTGTLVIRHPLTQSDLTLSVTLIASPEFAQRASATGFALASPGLPVNITLKGPVANLQLAL